MEGERLVYFILLSLLVGQRLYEMKISRNNAKKILKKGGIEKSPGHFPLIFLMHVFWFIACYAAGFAAQSFLGWGYLGLVVLLLGFCQWVRFATMHDLGESWNARIYIVPGDSIVERGIYRYVRHPNYAVVVLELALVPLLCGATEILLAFGLMNLFVLSIRIRAEENALQLMRNAERYMKETPRFIPLKFLSS